MNSSFRYLITNASEICIPDEWPGRGVQMVKNGTIAIENGRVHWAGPKHLLPDTYCSNSQVIVDAEQKAVLPALVDSHTHLIFGGDRLEDLERRSQGDDYAVILKKGGGIQTTVSKTRNASQDELFNAAKRRLELRTKYGIGTTEIKSGYGLSFEEEIRLLKIAQSLRDEGWDIESTLLGAHVVPPDCDREAYVTTIVDRMIPVVAQQNLARFVDVFVEKGAFSLLEARRIFEAATQAGLLLKIHADQLSSGGGAELAAEFKATSADHLEHISDSAITALAKARVVATLLPGALLYLGGHPSKLGRKLADQGVELAVATDTNPGSSPTQNLPLMASLAVTQFGLTISEAIRSVTRGAARALRRPDLGTFLPGSCANFVILEHSDSRMLIGSFGEPIVKSLGTFLENGELRLNY